MSEVDVAQIHFTALFRWMDRGLERMAVEHGPPVHRPAGRRPGHPRRGRPRAVPQADPARRRDRAHDLAGGRRRLVVPEPALVHPPRRTRRRRRTDPRLSGPDDPHKHRRAGMAARARDQPTSGGRSTSTTSATAPVGAARPRRSAVDEAQRERLAAVRELPGRISMIGCDLQTRGSARWRQLPAARALPWITTLVKVTGVNRSTPSCTCLIRIAAVADRRRRSNEHRRRHDARHVGPNVPDGDHRRRPGSTGSAAERTSPGPTRQGHGPLTC